MRISNNFTFSNMQLKRNCVTGNDALKQYIFNRRYVSFRDFLRIERDSFSTSFYLTIRPFDLLRILLFSSFFRAYSPKTIYIHSKIRTASHLNQMMYTQFHCPLKCGYQSRHVQINCKYLFKFVRFLVAFLPLHLNKKTQLCLNIRSRSKHTKCFG